MIDKLPSFFKNLFPCLLTHRSGVHKNLLNLLRPCAVEGYGIESFRKNIRENHHLTYRLKEEAYYEEMLVAKNSDQTRIYKVPDTFELFSSFNDKNGYNGYIPSASFLTKLYNNSVQERSPFMDRYMQSLDGVILKYDHSFKISEFIVVNGVKLYNAVLTISNEYNEILTQGFLNSKGHDEAKQLLKNLHKRYEIHNFRPVQLMYTDNCCGDRTLFENVFPSLQKDVERQDDSNVSNVTPDEQLQTMNVSDMGYEICYSKTAEDINYFCDEIMDELNKMDDPYTYIGLDCEWKTENNRKVGPVSVLQLA